MTKQPSTASLSIESLEVVHQVCNDFEQALREGRRPRIEQYLGKADEALHDELLRELLHLECDYRPRDEREALYAAYSLLFPQRQAIVDEVFAELLNPDTASLPGETFTAHSPPAGPTETQLEQPKVLGDYELLEEIASGGMGVVYKARQRSLGRIVALKMIKTGVLATEQQVQRFRTEAEAAAAIDHRGIVPVYEIGEEQGHHYFTMPYIRGASLQDVSRDRPLQSREAARLAARIALAVHAAHQDGILHRDLKPANILMEGREPRITDFGLAKRDGNPAGPTASTDVLGTPAYMAPEQARGDVAKISPATDVYGIGAILYQLLTGRPPFVAPTTVITMMQVVNSEPEPPRIHNPLVERDLETVCQKCLEKEPERRYASAAALAADLTACYHGQPVTARPISRIERAGRWVSQNRLLAGSLLLSLFLLLALVGTLTFVLSRTPAAKLSHASGQTTLASNPEPVPAGQAKVEGRHRQEPAKGTGETTAAASDPKAGEGESADGIATQAAEIGQPTDGIAEPTDEGKEPPKIELEPSSGNPEPQPPSVAEAPRLEHYLRDWALHEVAYDQSDWERGEELLRGLEPQDSSSPDLRGPEWYLRRSSYSARESGVAATFQKRFNEQLEHLIFAPSGDYAALIGKRMHVVSLPDLKVLHAIDMPRGFGTAQFLADGQTVAYAFAGHAPELVDFFSKTSIRKVGGDGVSLTWSLCLSPDEKRLALGTLHDVRIYDLQSGELLSTNPGRAYGLVFHPDGGTLAGADGSKVRFISSEDGNLASQLAIPSATRVAFHPDGETLAVSSGSGEITLRSVSDLSEVLTRMHDNTAEVHHLQFSADGSRLFSSGHDGRAHIWEPVTGTPLIRVQINGSITGFSVDPTGRWLVFLTKTGIVRVYPLDEFADSRTAASSASAGFPEPGTAPIGSGDRVIELANAVKTAVASENWRSASDLLAELFEHRDADSLEPSLADYCYHAALAALATKDDSRYLAALNRIQDRIEQSDKSLTRAAWHDYVLSYVRAGVLRQDTLSTNKERSFYWRDWNSFSKLVKQAAKDESESQYLAACYYRAGRNIDALSELRAAEKVLRGPEPHPLRGKTHGWILCFRAMAYAKEGHVERAREALRSAEWWQRIAKEELFGWPTPAERLEVKLLFEEAKEVIESAMP